MRWVWDGVFSVDIPEGWKVNEDGDLIEIVPPEPVGAVHISVLRRKREGAVRAGEASELAANFAERQGGAGVKPAERAEGHQRIATLEFETEIENAPDRLHWDVQVRVWNERALICSFCHDGRHMAVLSAASAMFSSIQPGARSSTSSTH